MLYRILDHMSNNLDCRPGPRAVVRRSPTPIYLWIWCFGRILQARDLREKSLYHLIIICLLFLQQVFNETCG